MSLGDLFDPPPLRWGLRGDPHLWQAMRRRFADDDLPADKQALEKAVETAFEEITGARMGDGTGVVRMPEYRIGSGMSDGMVSGEWWHTSARVLLRDRWHVAADER
ncbi:hypothetical protein KZ829_27360 [Actinoplanes hulinensis]|uniref:Uncharacterized protein n=1 Tax=Actinoplanes hulinensis TaxID=1144547 RepID=A0ABS7B8U5_9ACTN|nr:hypothetical protein [Actinoplanes hulinensis]MBW6437456.1 hypothetical protein [Actinoplanes hulinensis]